MAKKNKNITSQNSRLDFVKKATLPEVSSGIPPFLFPKQNILVKQKKKQPTKEDLENTFRIYQNQNNLPKDYGLKDKNADFLRRAALHGTLSKIDRKTMSQGQVRNIERQAITYSNYTLKELEEDFGDPDKIVPVIIGGAAIVVSLPASGATASAMSVSRGTIAAFQLAALASSSGSSVTSRDVDHKIQKAIYEYDQKNLGFLDTDTARKLQMTTESLDELKKNFPDELKISLEKALNGNDDDIKNYLDIKSTEIIEKTGKSINDILDEREAKAKEAKRKSLYDQQERDGQIYLTKFLANQFLNDKTAKQVTTGIDVAINIAGLVAANAGPWAMTTGFVGGMSALQGAFGSGDTEQPNPAIMAALKKMQQMLENIDRKLDIILENQEKILTRINQIAEEILDKQQINHIAIRRELKDIKESVLANREFNRNARQDDAYNLFDTAIDTVERQNEEDGPRLESVKSDALKTFYDHAIFKANDTIFNGRMNSWKSSEVKDEWCNISRLDLHIDKIPLFIAELTGEKPKIGPKSNSATNPLEWAKGAAAFTQTLSLFPRLIRDNDVKRKLKKLKETGEQIKEDVQEILKPENVQAALDYYKLTITAVIDNGIEDAKKSTIKKTGIKKDALEKLHYHSKYLTKANYKEKEKLEIRKLEDFILPTSGEELEENLIVGEPEESSYMIKTNSNLFATLFTPRSDFRYFTTFGNWFTTKNKNPIFIAENIGLIKLEHIKNAKEPKHMMMKYSGRRGKTASPSEIKKNGKHQTPLSVNFDAFNHDRMISDDFINNRNPMKINFNAYKIIIISKTSKYKNQKIGDDNHGWTIAEIVNPETDDKICKLSFLSDAFVYQNKKNLEQSLFSTGDILDFMNQELLGFHQDNKVYLLETMKDKITDLQTTLANEYEATAYSLQALGALKYWNDGNSLEEATAIAKDHGYLFTLLKPESEELEDAVTSNQSYKQTIKNVYERVRQLDPIIEDEVTVTDHVRKEMLCIIEKNLEKFEQSLFKESFSKIQGMPEVEFALEMINQIEKQYKL